MVTAKMNKKRGGRRVGQVDPEKAARAAGVGYGLQADDGAALPDDAVAAAAAEGCERVQQCVEALAPHAVLASTLAALERALSPGALADVTELVCYGLGSPSRSPVARHQLALVALLRDRLPGLGGAAPALYDPVFTRVDRAMLGRLGMRVIEADEGGARRGAAAGTTLFYLAHCESDLCESLLGANWEEGALERVCVLGNSFRTYHERWTLAGNQAGRRRPERLLWLSETGGVTEVGVSDRGYPAVSAFNDTAAHTFRPDWARWAGRGSG